METLSRSALEAELSSANSLLASPSLLAGLPDGGQRVRARADAVAAELASRLVADVSLGDGAAGADTSMQEGSGVKDEMAEVKQEEAMDTSTAVSSPLRLPLHREEDVRRGASASSRTIQLDETTSLALEAQLPAPRAYDSTRVALTLHDMERAKHGWEDEEEDEADQGGDADEENALGARLADHELRDDVC